MLPTFLVIGARKSGTTSLHGYLAAHPQVLMSRPKELKFFVLAGDWERGRAWYESHFDSERPGVLARGESSPDYARCTVHPGVPERIAEMLPEVRLVYLVRDPVERARSLYQHAVAFGVERRPIDEAVRDPDRYLDDSRYMMQIDRYLDVVSADQLLVISSDALRADRDATLAQVAGHVGVDPQRFSERRTAVERYSSAERKAPSPLLATLRSSWIAPATRRIVPSGIRRRIWASAARPMADQDVQMAASTAAWIVEELEDDRRRLAAFCPPAVTWGAPVGADDAAGPGTGDGVGFLTD